MKIRIFLENDKNNSTGTASSLSNNKLNTIGILNLSFNLHFHFENITGYMMKFQYFTFSCQKQTSIGLYQTINFINFAIVIDNFAIIMDFKKSCCYY